MNSWLNRPLQIRYVSDVLLLMFFLIASAPMATGIAVHEWISFVYLVPFIVHLLLHWDWLMAIPKRFFGKLPLQQRFNVILNVVLYVLMIFVTLSGILISEAALPLLGLTLESDSFWHTMHHNSSNLLLPLLGIHLALHWSWIINTTRKIFNKPSPKMAKASKEGGHLS